MSLEQLLLILIGVILAANAAVVAVGSLQDRRRLQSAAEDRDREDPGTAGEGRGNASVRRIADVEFGLSAAPPPGRGPRRDVDEDARTSAAIEAFVAEVNGDPGDRLGAPSSSRAIAPLPATERRAPNGPLASTGAASRSRVGADEDIAEPADSATWERMLQDESARFARFGRPVTVVSAEFPNFAVVADRLGPIAADRVANEIGRRLQAECRATDRLARFGRASFAVLLIETEELDARRFVERCRVAADDWLESAGLSGHLAIGLASPGHDNDLGAAAATARERMHGVDRRNASHGRRGDGQPPVRAGSGADTRV